MIGTIVFSRDRACQLDLLLRSLEQHAPMLGRPTVLWTTSHVGYQIGYRILQRDHPSVRFIREQSFADDLRTLLVESPDSLACFLVDDDVVFRTVGLDAQELLGDPQILAFSLRLGWNTTFCYPLRCSQRHPQPLRTAGECCVWDWRDASCDFGYPASLDGDILRTADALAMLGDSRSSNPNRLEDVLSQAVRTPWMMERRPLLASYRSSALVGIPANVVTRTHENRNAALPEFSIAELNRRYVAGERIQADRMDFRHVNAAHSSLPYVLA